MIDKLEQLIRRTSQHGSAFWLDGPSGRDARSIPAQDHADIIYTLFLAGRTDMLSREAAEAYQSLLATAQLFARPEGVAVSEKAPNAHLTAYLLGAARLLETAGVAARSESLFQGWVRDKLIDDRHLPCWPRNWSHHIWRVSHWIGGIPSILLQLADSGRNAGFDRDLVARVFEACEANIFDRRTGLLKPYRSALLQQLFRTAYRLRHDPDVGEVGGVVHLLWVYHAAGREYVAAESLFERGWRHMQTRPFIERVPYCLDFDIVQLVRTTQQHAFDKASALVARSRDYRRDTARFLMGDVPASYTLHKLPGALATMHESAMIERLERLPELDIEPIDIIREAYWI